MAPTGDVLREFIAKAILGCRCFEQPQTIMSESIWLGAVAYDPKVVTIWEGMRRYFHEEAGLPVEVVLFQSYEAQVMTLLAGENDGCRGSISPGIRISRFYNPSTGASSVAGRLLCAIPISVGPLRFLPSPGERLKTLLISETGRWLSGAGQWPCRKLTRDFLQSEGLIEEKDYRTALDSDVGKHGDTGRSEAEVVRAVLDGRADAGAEDSRVWKTLNTERLVPEGALTEIWTSPPFNHCMFTA